MNGELLCRKNCPKHYNFQCGLCLKKGGEKTIRIIADIAQKVASDMNGQSRGIRELSKFSVDLGIMNWQVNRGVIGQRRISK